MNMEILTTREAEAWARLVAQCPRHDFFHLPRYHALTEEFGEGKAHLFFHVEGVYTIALPLLLRSLDNLPGVRPDGDGWQDATSVYGYAGPIASHEEIPASVLRNFHAALQERLRDMGVVAVFSRLHPILPHAGLLAGLGECRTLGRTVSIDLTLPLEAQRTAFRKNHKEGINKLRRQGVTCVQDRDGSYFDDFVEIYHATMERVGAAPNYFFPPAYFRALEVALGERLSRFVCLHHGKVVCGGIFVECGDILHYHLGGTSNDALKIAPMKQLIDDTRVWAHGRGLKHYHLGGGATTQPNDPLLHFKLGFSDRTHDFTVWRWVLLPEVYRRLCLEKARWNEQHRLDITAADYFPQYRTPTVASLMTATRPAPRYEEPVFALGAAS